MPTVYQECADALRAALQPLVPGTFRSVEWNDTTLGTRPALPAITLVADDETVERENMSGYQLRRRIIITVEWLRDRPTTGTNAALADQYLSAVIQQVEATPDLGGAALKLEYVGHAPYQGEDATRMAMAINYDLIYTRKTANPNERSC